MKVILNDFVRNLGDSGDAVEVADGYARNYLIPKKLAFEANKANIKTYENNLKQKARKLARLQKEAEAQKESLEGVGVLEFIRKAGESGKLFGSVTTADICAVLEEKGYEIDKRKMVQDNPIKSLGQSEVKIKLHPQVTAVIKVEVKAELVEEPPAEEEAGETASETGEAGDYQTSGQDAEEVVEETETPTQTEQ